MDDGAVVIGGPPGYTLGGSFYITVTCESTMDLKIATTQFLPLTNHLLIQRDEVESRTKEGLIIPEASKVPALTGRVVAIGPDASPSLAVGTRCLFGKYAGTNLTINEAAYLLMPDKDVLARIQDPAATDPTLEPHTIGGVANG